MKHSQRSEAITISLQPIRPAMLAWHTFLECILRIHETEKVYLAEFLENYSETVIFQSCRTTKISR